MLGKTAGGLYWMFRYLERGENTARLIEAGFRIALTRSIKPESEWQSVLSTSAVGDLYAQTHDGYAAADVIDFLLRDPANPSSVLTLSKQARDNARLVRTALTTEVWEAVNENWLSLSELLKEPIIEADLPETLGTIRRHSALVRGALHGTMLRNDIYDFARIGTFLERADNTARILDVKYYTLLPSARAVGSPLDHIQWETVLRSVSAHRSYRWLNASNLHASAIAEFLILDRRLPRSLYFCASKLRANLNYLADDYDAILPCQAIADDLRNRMRTHTIDTIFDEGLHDFLNTFINDINTLGLQIERDYRFMD